MPALTLSELATLCGAVLDGDGTRLVEGPASLAEASPREISFLASPRYRSELLTTRAGAVVVAHDVERPRPDLALLRCKDPNRAFTAVVGAFVTVDPAPRAGVHPTAVVDPEAHVDASAAIGALCVVGAGARIGPRVVLHPNVTVGRSVEIGAETVLHSGVRLYARVEIGARCIVHSGAVIGSDGYGFEPTREGWVKIPQVGTVVIEDDVEIGANCTIERGRFGATRIGRGVKMDNLVHVAHNVVVGEAALLVAQVGIAGSSRIGARAILAGQAGVAGHVEVGAGARIGGQGGVTSDVPAGADYAGMPARPRGETLRQWALAERLPELNQRVRDLEASLAALARKVEAAGEDSP